MTMQRLTFDRLLANGQVQLSGVDVSSYTLSIVLSTCVADCQQAEHAA